MTRVSGGRFFVASKWLEPAVRQQRVSANASRRFLKIAALTIAGTAGICAHADAAVFWSESDSGFARPIIAAPATPPPPRAQRARRHKEKQIEAKIKEAAKPQGPLIIAISINKQNVRIYDANGMFAEAPVSTGMAGHATPMGAFSVIQKQKMHHSNIYSGAPMPFMQRITWSGVAMHAGVLPGHPASHGCIRMPMAFAVKMYGWTRMGARVIVAPGELSPAPFSHPLLVTQKVMPQPVAADVPKPDAATKTVAKADTKPATPEPNLELRSTVGHDSQMPAVISEPSAPVPLSGQTHTADAGASPAPITMSDAKADAEPVSIGITDKTAEAASSEHKPVEAEVAEFATPEQKPTEIATTDQAGQPGTDAPPKADAQSGSETVMADVAVVQTPKDAAKTKDHASAPAAETPAPAAEISEKVTKKVAENADDKTGAKPGDDVTAAAAAPASAADTTKDQGRVSDPEKPVAPDKPALAMAKGSGPISVFISRKDGKLYVRQNFSPLFAVPVTIAPSDRPFGTHIFTAEADKTDTNILHWSVVTLPQSRRVERRDEDERGSRHRKMAGAAEIAKPVVKPDSPAEALDRITIPADAMARITDALSTGGSIIVSDQGIAAGETGEGTDFIVSLR
jgi:lipoprotein-anchoring transpeptidase ErfK/SrfK